jgi:hypothetical protein
MKVTMPASPKDNPSALDRRGATKATLAWDAVGEVPLPADDVDGLEPSKSWFQRWSLSVPAWLVSMLVHIALILFMAAYHLPEIGNAISEFVVNSSPGEAIEELEEFSIDEAMSIDAPQEAAEVVPEAAPMMQEVVTEVPVDVQIDTIAPALTSVDLSNISSEIFSSGLTSGETTLKKGLSSRGKESKRDLLERYGGNSDTEKAVAAALKWLSQHQLPDGSWTFVHGLACGSKCKDNGTAAEAKNAATGLALMAFLGAGQTHLEGEYKPTVFKGLSFLIRNMQASEGKIPSWYVRGSGGSTGVMYAHGIAAIAMCEAYGMTKDPDLKQVAQAAINFIVYAQDPSGGGWWYNPRTGGDTSVVGWQLMALKSASMSNLGVPVATLKKAQRYLDSVASKDGAAYGYRKPGDRPEVSAMTACGLLCKMYMGMPRDHAGLQAAVKGFAKKGLDTKDVYYNYYATQVMKQVGGPLWEEWDGQMKRALLSSQETSGHAAGSWYFRSAKHAEPGGRLYMTCMSTMMLEVYYRYMPIYGDQSEEEAFKL